MSYNITLLPGDGIGPEITAAAIKIIKHTGVDINWEIMSAGMEALDKYRDPLPQETIDSIGRNKLALKGPLTTPIGKGFRSINVALRKEFDLYVNQRPAKTFKGVTSRYDNIDILIFRENTEEFYSGIEHYIDSSRSAAETIGITTRRGCERILKYAFEQTQLLGRKKITIVHKANIMKFTGGLFLDISKEVAVNYPLIKYEDKIVDNMAMQMVMNPNQFDAIVTTNLFGDILSDLASGLVGGLGFAPGANIGQDVAIFEAVHGSAPDIAGQNIANPCALILGGVMLLNYIGEHHAADRIEKAVSKVIEDGLFVTRDINPTNYVGTKEMGEAILEKLDRQ
ncbi:MAG: isocitrate dehydrogenase [Ignavibacteria bacterium CG22_combo_CG10-13_8_21_14_all_37_15]|nr:NAD-dependent isocitrate dehydrogenase [Ignavibacteria bacterium]OIO16937.1 MAG: isocitrate dehydrogenase [Ignavibacteria bacterium CG1_02_37_35]PIP77500.1 MAG: isocitrate dehydrogenase [Ignavibacteria bacterium CG22_combo_CG10-13_8_21_14_all_37_15]PIS45134.1 MAG: isocitrate dehydrogenase [Ignavibacteria bacterium CG08_land_8_20_14_0_20_37_9]PIX94843.1 MAG: isocitrate dehydrogenase [Ignavibacteria bacterium CG_4_10_14_3_um_filter_37_18]PJC58458.1 MAG: isocitrate dehydrogenase [Ignavibacteri